MRPFDALLFDLGNTLIYFDGDRPQVFAQADAELLHHLKLAGLNLEGEAFLKDFRTRLNEYFTERESAFIEYTTAHILRTLLADWGYAQVPAGLIRSVLRAMYAVSEAHWQLEADTIPTLSFLCKEGYRLGIISNASDDDNVLALVDKAGIRQYFDLILSSAAVGIRKPNPRIFNLALENWAIPPSRVAMIGDTLGADILGAKNAGLFSIWLTRRADVPANRAHADTLQSDAVISTLSELVELLAQMS
jgi:HAD superfamily hydrolase (TIGR01662 family)